MDALTDRLQHSTLQSPGEGALSVFSAYSSVSEHIQRDICALRTYVPGAVRTEDEFKKRQAVIRELERDLCDAAYNSHILALVSKDIRRTVLLQPAVNDALDVPARMWLHEEAIKTQLRRLMCAMVEYGCGDDKIDVERNVTRYHEKRQRRRNLGGDESQIVMPQKTCHEWRSYQATDSPRQQTLDLLTTLQQGLHIYNGGFNEDGASIYPRKCHSVRDLLGIVDVVPHLPLPKDDSHRRELRRQCEVIAKLTRDYYDSFFSISEYKFKFTFENMDKFMHARCGIRIDRDVFNKQLDNFCRHTAT